MRNVTNSILSRRYQSPTAVAVYAVAVLLVGVGFLHGDAAVLDWVPGSGGDNVSLYQEANWRDPDTGVAPPTGTVDPNTDVNRSLRIRKGIPGGGGGASAHLQMGSGTLWVSHATLRMNPGQQAGIDMGASNPELTVVDGQMLAEFINRGVVTLKGRSELTLYGSAPLTNTTIDLQSSDCFVLFLRRRPADIDGAYLSNFTVNGAPAVLWSNVEIREYYNGAALRPIPPGSVGMKGFTEPDLQGTRFNYTTGFYGGQGIGGVTYGGWYNVTGWGSDIWSTGDEFHFGYRPIVGDGEIIARVQSVEDTHASAKAGVMIRESLEANARYAMVLQRPDNQVTLQARFSPGGVSSSYGFDGDTNTIKYVRLVRSGNSFSGYYSTNSAAGPWTQISSAKNINMSGTVYLGPAVTSHNGAELCLGRFSDVSAWQGGVPLGAGAVGIFDANQDIYDYWPQDNQIRSFLLKKGYQVTLSTEAAGQGVSKVYAATEEDLAVNLPPELDGQVSFMRVLPWRWIARKGWAGANDNGYPTTINAYWNYEWEPTGSSSLNREFVPMIKGRTQNKDYRWEEVRVRANQTHFLGFNEPMSANQGDLTVDEAIALWPKAQQLGLRLGSPARTDGSIGDNWLQGFMFKAATNGYRVDYVCVHNYNKKTASALKTWLDAEYAKYGLPIWLTEFHRDDSDNPTQAQNLAYLEEVLPMLESLSYLERYSYYNWGVNTTLFNGDGTTNALGHLYANIFSNPAYRNTGNPPWCAVELTSPANGDILFQPVAATTTASVSLSNSVISSVEFFADDQSIGVDTTEPSAMSLGSLPAGLHSLYATATTAFGERASSAATQVLVANLEILPGSPDAAGTVRWSAMPGATYRLEYCVDLAAPDWTLVTQRTASTLVEQVTDPGYGLGVTRFYRVVWMP